MPLGVVVGARCTEYSLWRFRVGRLSYYDTTVGSDLAALTHDKDWRRQTAAPLELEMADLVK